MLNSLNTAPDYEAWEKTAGRLDGLLKLDEWRDDPSSHVYDCPLISERLRFIDLACKDSDLYTLIKMLRVGLVRNLGNITSPKLFNHSFGGTKHLIDDYITHFAEAIDQIARLPLPGATEGFHVKKHVRKTKKIKQDDGNAAESSKQAAEGGSSKPTTVAHSHSRAVSKRPMVVTISSQTKLNFVHDARQALGRSALLLQGGAIFGLCHLGVVKALYLRGLLPRIIVGTATGAMMAALVGVHHDDDLPRVLKGDGIDLSAFTGRARDPAGHGQAAGQSIWTKLATASRRIQRFRKEGYFLDVTVLEECIRTNIGDLTFEEAYNRSKRILNITVAPAGQHGIPTLLNYVTAPNVVSSSSNTTIIPALAG